MGYNASFYEFNGIEAMKQTLHELLCTSLLTLQKQFDFPDFDSDSFVVERGRQPEHGDFASNAALKLNKSFQRKPRELAKLIIDNMPHHPFIDHIEIAGPGFINFFISDDYFFNNLQMIHQNGQSYGLSQRFAGCKAHVEFVSVNPTGPLHVGHGRNAVYGSALSRLLEAVGYQVHREYYVNDAGRQMAILTVSIWLRYLQNLGAELAFPEKAYQGDYVITIAEDLCQRYGDQFAQAWSSVDYQDVVKLGDADEVIDELVVQAKRHLGMSHYNLIYREGLQAILNDIKEDLQALGVNFDEWFSEQSLVDNGFVEKGLEQLRSSGYVYQGDDGAVWFRSQDLGDDKDRVLVRSDGRSTYFASDVAYHLYKIERQYDLIVDVLGADHHGYIPRLCAAMQALGHGHQNFVTPIVQFASLYKDGEKVSMSTRSGSFVPLRQLREEVGSDATRYFYLMRKVEQPVDFDIDLAKSRSTDNPVYYVQYAHARIMSIFQQAKQAGYDELTQCTVDQLAVLNDDVDHGLLRFLDCYPETVEQAALQYDPHHLTMYLYQLAQHFHRFYSVAPIVTDKQDLTQARLYLVQAIRQVLVNGLNLLAITAVESM